jgi:hypothetical protein
VKSKHSPEETKRLILEALQEGWSIHVAVRRAETSYDRYLRLKRADGIFAREIEEIFQRNLRHYNFISMAVRTQDGTL